MDRFKRIAHRGWLRSTLSVLTFGYFPYTEITSVVYGTITGGMASGALSGASGDGVIIGGSAAGSLFGGSVNGTVRSMKSTGTIRG